MDGGANVKIPFGIGLRAPEQLSRSTSVRFLPRGHRGVTSEPLSEQRPNNLTVRAMAGPVVLVAEMTG